MQFIEQISESFGFYLSLLAAVHYWFMFSKVSDVSRLRLTKPALRLTKCLVGVPGIASHHRWGGGVHPQKIFAPPQEVSPPHLQKFATPQEI